MSSLFGYFDFGLRAMNAARLGLAVAGDNIANATTPGYARRRVELQAGMPVKVDGGWLDRGVEVGRLRRMEDRLVQGALEREQGTLGENEERLEGLRSLQAIFGTLESSPVSDAYGAFSAAFDALAVQPENTAIRREAVSSATTLAANLRSTYERVTRNRRDVDLEVGATVDRINQLAANLATLNQQIAESEVDGSTAAPLRDGRGLVLEELTELTGGNAVYGPNGRVGFNLPSGPTLVTGDDRLPVAIPLVTSRDPDGFLRISSAGMNGDLTDRLREGRLGAELTLRDVDAPEQLRVLDALASDLTTRANAITTASRDLNGAAGTALFVPDPPSATGQAASIMVAAAIVADPRLLAVSASGAPGDGSGARQLAAIRDSASATLGGRTPVQFLGDSLSRLGNEVSRVEVAREVSSGLTDDLRTRRDAITGVSLDEEATELIKNQRAFEAAARFLATLNDVTETAINIGR
jgi:flagellar hook-associated protein 1 FlgK